MFKDNHISNKTVLKNLVKTDKIAFEKRWLEKHEPTNIPTESDLAWQSLSAAGRSKAAGFTLTESKYNK